MHSKRIVCKPLGARCCNYLLDAGIDISDVNIWTISIDDICSTPSKMVKRQCVSFTTTTESKMYWHKRPQLIACQLTILQRSYPDLYRSTRHSSSRHEADGMEHENRPSQLNSTPNILIRNVVNVIQKKKRLLVY